ncbi:MAG: hypothetical protein JWR09_902 [Mucilaginibacter sp.]|nr:hypothetical protein [Mucilaginibacter sp.]
MKKIKDTPRIIGVLILLTLYAPFIQAQPTAPKEPMLVNARATSSLKQSPELRDGQHDFDFHVGKWKSSIKRLLHPLTGSTTWIEMKGTLDARKVWDGRAQIEELEADGPSGHIEDLLLFLYNPQSHQWSLNAAASNDGTMGTPMTGEFKNGRGEFFDQEPFKGRTVLVRQVWSDITPTSHRFEQAFSDDGGKTWEINFIANLERQN